MKPDMAAVTILRTNDTHEAHEVGRHILMDWCRRMIGADTIDTVNLRDGRVMIVDDVGYEARKPINTAATALYHSVCKPNTTHQIVGDVAIAWDRDVE